MWRATLVGLSIVTFGFPACSHAAPSRQFDDGTLVLEIGGSGTSLRGALVAAGVVTPPLERLHATPLAEPPPAGKSDTGTEPSPAGDPLGAAPGPASSPSAGHPDYVTVKLARGQTLIHLAKQHLGDGNRFREILALNGWTDTDARRLRENQLVKVPTTAAALSGGQ